MTKENLIRVVVMELTPKNFPANYKTILKALHDAAELIPAEYRETAQMDTVEGADGLAIYVIYERPMTVEELDEHRRSKAHNQELLRVQAMNLLRRAPELFNDIKEGKVNL